MTPSIYDYWDHEIKVHEEIKKRNRRELIENIICAPILIALFIIMLFI